MNKTASTVLKVLRCIPAIFIGCCSWYLSSQPHVPLPDFNMSDKVVHLACFAGFSFFTAMAFFGLKPSDGRKSTIVKRILLPVLVISLYGIIDEIHQSFVPGRSCSILDWCADTVGALIGSTLFFFLVKLLSRKK
ncbi:MAG: VanZ family protein [Treponema sp.]|nr:VanZ family protein [Treponema sp.]